MSKEADRLEEIIIRLKTDQLVIALEFGKWLADNCDLGMRAESKHKLYLENRTIEITLLQGIQIFTGHLDPLTL